MTSFRDALDAFEARLDAVEAALAAGEDPHLPDVASTTLSGPVDAEDATRLEHLLDRSAAVQAAIEAARGEVLEELAGLGRRRTAVTTYASHT